jgi:hypothetical protein
MLTEWESSWSCWVWVGTYSFRWRCQLFCQIHRSGYEEGVLARNKGLGVIRRSWWKIRPSGSMESNVRDPGQQHKVHTSASDGL